MSFSQLDLHPLVLVALGRLQHIRPTPVQLEAIPPILQGRDVLVRAPTGSGKTLAFVLALLNSWVLRAVQAKRLPYALVLVPTRDLAIQVGAVMSQVNLGLGKPAKVSVVFGGVSINPQLIGLRGGTDIVVATPGRILDLVDRRGLCLDGVRCLVLDEADRLMDQGFADEVHRIKALLLSKHQSLYFSATFNPEFQQLARTELCKPVEIGLDPASQPKPDIVHRAILVESSRRTQLLCHLIHHETWSRVLVFVASQYAAEIIADKLRRAGYAAEPFHGRLSQGKRSQVLSDFKTKVVRVVVATDVAARGLDIADLPVVVSYDLPRSPADYVHRAGRTARAGRAGLSTSFITSDNSAHFALIEKRNRLEVSRECVPGFEVTMPLQSTTADQANGGIKGRRPSKKDKLRAAGLRPPLG
ncbi:MAG: DEAD/DEAH box helicase [Rhodoferax sp.]|nr:DEAD/DEAH box helicase [Rhodoferax sp.]